MKPGKSKSKGNAFENTTAKQLGTWIFDDKNVLGRHLTSGAIKTTYMGDIVPIKQFPIKFNGMYPLLIECKHGYKDNIPTLINQYKLKKWLTKCIDEQSQTTEQTTIFLIVKFKYQKTILLTNYLIDPNINLFNLAIPIIYGDKIWYFYIYILNELLELNFFELFPNIWNIKTC